MWAQFILGTLAVLFGMLGTWAAPMIENKHQQNNNNTIYKRNVDSVLNVNYIIRDTDNKIYITEQIKDDMKQLPHLENETRVDLNNKSNDGKTNINTDNRDVQNNTNSSTDNDKFLSHNALRGTATLVSQTRENERVMPICGDAKIFLLIVVCSAVEHWEHRAAIRETWGRELNSNIKLVFLVGITKSVETELKVEQSKHQDTIQVDVLDTYSNLTLKSIAMLQWVQKYCHQARFVLKSDDDIFINVPLLVKDLQNTIHERFLMGHVIAGAEPDRNPQSKWYTPAKVYPSQRYPEYLSGCAYVISGDLLDDFVEVTSQIPLFWIEDVFITAICAKQIEARHVFNPKFGYRQRDNWCASRHVITSHRLTPATMRTLWKLVHSGDSCL